MDYKNGIFQLNTPKAKAVAGFLNTKKVFQLGDVTIQSQNDYVTIELVSMDGDNIDQSKKILLQVGTLFRPANWKEEPAVIASNCKKLSGFKIINTGNMPWLGMPANGSISIKNTFIKKAIQLDAGGYAIKQLAIKVTNDTLLLQLPKDAMYILME